MPMLERAKHAFDAGSISGLEYRALVDRDLDREKLVELVDVASDPISTLARILLAELNSPLLVRKPQIQAIIIMEEAR